MSSKDTRAGAIRAATKGICTILLSKNPPFVEVSRAASNKFEEELKILRNCIVRNPTPAACFDLNDSEDDDASEIVVLGGNQQQPPEQQQQQPFQQQQQQQPFQQQQQQQPFHQQQQLLQQQYWAQQPNWMPPMQQMQSNQVWGPQQIIIGSEESCVADCDWEDKKLMNASCFN